jgi:hypothetical protein
MLPARLRKRNAALTLVLISLSGCMTPSRNAAYQESGHLFRTKIGCVRTAKVSDFDRKCDVPFLGYGGFANP